ncbi:MAG: hypothetical protein IPN13_14240 [Bacteroidetes bacterium]|nr:hypothetical protein [Bacteroidota bacterium]
MRIFSDYNRGKIYQPNAIQQTPDGGYIVGGSSDSNISGEKTENSNGLSDFWVLKLEHTPAFQWH